MKDTNKRFKEGTNLCAAIMYIYPDTQPERDFMLQDDSDGIGPYIAKWITTEHEKPTYEQLQEVLQVLNQDPMSAPLPLSDADKELLDQPAL